MNSLTLPLCMGYDIRRRVSVPLPPDVYAAIEDAADRRELGLGIGPYCARLVRRFFRLDFLAHDNIAFLAELRAHLPGMELLDVLNVAVTQFRQAVRSGKLVPAFLAGQSQNKSNSCAPMHTRARKAPDVVAVKK